MINIYTNSGHTICIDDEDRWALMYVWSLDGSGYPQTKTKTNGKCLRLHKMIAERINLIGEIDHKDRNKCNCKRDNIRLSNKLNSANIQKDKLKGVYWHNQAQKWMAGITHKGKFQSLGLFIDPMDAAKAYNRAAKMYFGEFAVLNSF